MKKEYLPARDLKPLGDMSKSGIKFKLFERDTGKEVHWGVQLNNTTQEIETLPNLRIEINGYSELYEALKALMFQFAMAVEHPYSGDKKVYEQAEQALAGAEGK